MVWPFISCKTCNNTNTIVPRQTYQPGYQSAQIPTLASLDSRGACRTSLRQSSCTQLLLDQPGFHLQVLRSYPSRPSAQSHSSRSSHQLDCEAGAQASRVSWPHLYRQKVAWSQQRASLQQHQGWEKKDLEETEHSFAVALQVDVLNLITVTISQMW